MKKLGICAAVALVFSAPMTAQQMDEPLSRWDLVREAGLPAAGHYTLGGLTYNGAEGVARLLLPDGSKHWANELGLATTLVAALAFEHDPLFNAEDKATDGVSAASIQLDGGFDFLERTASGIGDYLGDTMGAEFKIGFQVAAFIFDFLVTTEADRDLRQINGKFSVIILS